MFQELDLQKRGDLRKRLTAVSWGGTEQLSQKQFMALIKEQLRMKDNDIIKLMKASGFSSLKDPSKPLPIDVVVNYLQDIVEKSAKNREDIVKKISKYMKDEGINISNFKAYFDQDESGTITRAELTEGFKRMKVTLSESLIRNLFTILDKNCDDTISIDEFALVF